MGLLPRRAFVFPLFHKFGYPVLRPINITVVTTHRCNSLCNTCNIGKNFRKDPNAVLKGEMTLDEYETVFRTLGPINWVTLSGGEPFLRTDLADLCKIILKYGRPALITIPTNGSLPKTIESMGKTIIPHLNGAKLLLNFSVDGVGPQHDKLRGHAGNFKLLTDSIHRVRALNCPDVLIGVNTTLSRWNVKNYESIQNSVDQALRPDSFVVEPAQIRPEYFNGKTKLHAPPSELADALRIHLNYLREKERFGTSRVIKAFRIHYYEQQLRALNDKTHHRCLSGYASCQIMPKGEVWSNATRAEVLGNLRDFNGNFMALWRSERAKIARKKIRKDICTCQVANTSYVNKILKPHDVISVIKNAMIH